MIALYKIPRRHQLNDHDFCRQERLTFDGIYLHHVDRHLTRQQTFNELEKYSLFETTCTDKESVLFALIAKCTIERVRLLTYCKQKGFYYHISDCDRMISKYECVMKINDDREVKDETPYSVHEVEDDPRPRPVIEQKFVEYNDPQTPSQLCPIIHMDGEQLSYVNIKFSDSLSKNALVDTGACGNAIPQEFYNRLRATSTVKIGNIENPDFTTVKLASGKKLAVIGQIEATFSLGGLEFREKFLILPEMNSIILGNPFFKKHGINISPQLNILKLPELTLQLNTIGDQRTNNKPEKHLKYKIKVSKKLRVEPHCQEVVTCEIDDGFKNFDSLTGVVEPIRKFEKKTGLCVLTSLSTVQHKNKIVLSVINVKEHPITVPSHSLIATFTFLTPEQAERLYPVDPQLIALAKLKNSKDFEGELNMLLRDETFDSDRQPPRPCPDYRNFWFPTPEKCSDPQDLTPLQREIYDKLKKLQQEENIDPQRSPGERSIFPAKFQWSESLLNDQEKLKLEDLLVQYSDIFAKHRFDVGYNTEIKIKLTPEHSMPTYMQSPPTPIHLRDELLVELALMQYYNIITTLPYSKYSSPIFAQRKSSGKLRVLIDLRRINHLFRHDYKNNKFPISNMTDATNHFAGKTLFCKLDCSQAYHCVQMADEQSVQMLAFNFASRTFAYRRIAQGLSKSVTGFSSFVRHYLDPCLAADLCTQFMDDIGSGSRTFEEMISNLRKIFDCLRRAGLKLSAAKCQFGVPQITYLGNVITAAGIRPEEEKIKEFLQKVRMPQTVKQVKRLIGFLQFFRTFIPSLNEKLLPFYRLLRKTTSFTIEDDHRSSFETLKTDLLRASNTTLRLAKPGKQFVILCDASYHGTGFVLMIEDYLNQDSTGAVKTYAPVSFGSKLFNSSQLKLSIYCKEFLSLYFALEQFAHFVWGAVKPVIVLTDNKSLVRFFQAKTLPPTLWSYLDRVLSFNVILAHIPGKANHAADFFVENANRS